MIAVTELALTVIADQLDRSRCKRHSRCSWDIPGICSGLSMRMPRYTANCDAGSGAFALKPRRRRCSIASYSAHALKPRRMATPVHVAAIQVSLGLLLHMPV